MTLILANRDGILADRRVTGGNGSIYMPSRKVFRGPTGVVAAFAGPAGACDRARHALEQGETDPDLLGQLAEGFLLTPAGVLFELSGGGAVRVPARLPFGTGGSGFAEAQAFLYGRGAPYDVDAFRAAGRYTARYRVDVGDGFDWMARE